MASKASGAGVEVAQISVKVSPDTRAFRGDLKKKLEAIEKGLNARVGTEADTKGLKQKIESAARGAKARVDVELNTDRMQRRLLTDVQSTLAKMEPRIPITLNGEKFRREIDKFGERISKRLKLDVPLDPAEAVAYRKEVDKFAAALKKIEREQPLQQLKVFDDGDAAAQAKNQSKFQRDLFKLSNQARENQKRLELQAQADELAAKTRAFKIEQDAIKLTERMREEAHKKELARVKYEEWQKAEFLRQREANLSPFQRSSRDQVRKLYNDIQVQIPATIDGEHLRRDLDARVKVLERTIHADLPVDLHLRAGARAKILAEIASLKAFSGSLGTKDEGFFSRLSDGVKSFGRGVIDAIPNVRAFGIGLVGLLAIASLLAPALAIVSGVLVAIPGLVAAFVAPLAVVALGFDGIKKAAEEAGIIGHKGPKDKNTPIGEALKAVQKDVSEVFSTGLTPVFKQLMANFAAVTPGFKGIAQGVVEMMKGFTNATSGEGLNKINNIIGKIAEGLTASAPAVEKFTSGLLTLISGTANKFPNLGAWFSDMGDKFDKWATKMTTAGPDGVSPLDKALHGVKETADAVLKTLGNLFGKGLESIGTGQMQKDIEKFFEGIDNFVNTTLPALERMFTLLTDIINLIPRTETPEQQKEANTKRVEELKNNDPPGWDFISWSQKAGIQVRDWWNNTVWPAIKEGATSAWASITQTVSTAWNGIAGFFQGIPAQLAGIWEGLKQGAIDALAGIGQWFSQIPQQLSAAWGSLSGIASGAWASVTQAVSTAWEQAKAAVTEGIGAVVAYVGELPGKIGAALGSLGGLLVAAGRAAMDGLLSGIKAGAEAVYNFVSGIANKIASLKGPLPYDRVVLIPNGEALMEGLGKGMENGFQPVLDQAKDMAGRVADAFSSGGDPTTVVNGFSKAEVNRMEKTLSLESKRMEMQAKALEYQAKMAGKGGMADSLNARAKEIRMQKDSLSLQKDMLDLTKDYNDESSAGGDPLVKAASGLMKSPVDFAKATGKQFMSDIGISGNGFISKALTEGINYTFQIGSVDEALSIKDREDSKRARTFIGR